MTTLQQQEATTTVEFEQKEPIPQVQTTINEPDNQDRSHRPPRSESTRSNAGSDSDLSSVAAEALAMDAIASVDAKAAASGNSAADIPSALESRNSVFVTGFPRTATKEDLKKFFDEKVGSCIDVSIREGRGRGNEAQYAFVFFGTADSKDAAVKLSGTELSAGHSLSVEEREKRSRGAGAGGAGDDRERRGGGGERRRRGERERRGAERRGDRGVPAGDFRDSDRCYTCGGIGHKARECPTGARRTASAPGRDSDRHRSSDYERRRESDYDRERLRAGDASMTSSSRHRGSERDGPRDSGIKCYNCGRTGHISARCPDRDGRRDRSVSPRGGADRRGDDEGRSRRDDEGRSRRDDEGRRRRDEGRRRFGDDSSSRRTAGGHDDYERRREDERRRDDYDRRRGAGSSATDDYERRRI